MELKDRIALARKRAGLSQEQLGERLGVSRQAVSKWESGQSNPDLSYVAAMCRLFGVSSDWLLLGEEGSAKSAPARCPNCQAAVTGMDNFCPQCGYSLKHLDRSTYTVVFQNKALSYGGELFALSRWEEFSQDSPLHGCLTSEQVQVLMSSAPFILDRGLSKEQVENILEFVDQRENYLVYRDSDGADVQSLMAREPVPGGQFRKPKNPLSFGEVTLAVAVGIVGAILLLSFL